MTDEEMYQRIAAALRQIRDGDRKWGRIVIDFDRGEPRHVNCMMEIKEDHAGRSEERTGDRLKL